MKFTINTILYLLCASVVTCNVSHVTNLVHALTKSDEQKKNDVYLEAFLDKCGDAVQGIWKGMHAKKTTLEQDFAEAEAYVDKYTWVSHQTGRIKNDFVKALYDKMKTYKHMSLKSNELIGLDEIIKEGSVGLFKRQDSENLENIKYARLLCKIATNIFTWYMQSGKSLKAIKAVEEEIANNLKVSTEVKVVEEPVEPAAKSIEPAKEDVVVEQTPVDLVEAPAEAVKEVRVEATIDDVVIPPVDQVKEEAEAMQPVNNTVVEQIEHADLEANVDVPEAIVYNKNVQPEISRTQPIEDQKPIEKDIVGTKDVDLTNGKLWEKKNGHILYRGDKDLSDSLMENGGVYDRGVQTPYGGRSYQMISTRKDGKPFMDADSQVKYSDGSGN